jgi:hypothetical protein
VAKGHDRLPAMKTLVIRTGITLISLIVCASLIKFSYRHNQSLPFPNYDTFTWRVPQYLSYWWVRLTNPPENGSLRWRVQEAKRRGERQDGIFIHNCGTVLTNPQEALKDALSNFAVIVAEPIEKKSYEGKYYVKTWYRFRIIETLNPRPLAHCPGCINSSDPPSDLPPVGNDEILILQSGGTIMIDGVEVIDSFSRQPSYSLSQKYLLFLIPGSTKWNSIQGLGSAGIFEVDSKGILKHTTSHHNALSIYFLKHHQNSLDRLKSDIQRLEREILYSTHSSTVSIMQPNGKPLGNGAGLLKPVKTK